ncbi:MAG: GGDEF domain-containing protein [Rubrivivax sp.]|nr:GGDEF domain-containing protein [Rubrivivax sp.]
MSSQPLSLLWVGPGAPPRGLPAGTTVAAVATLDGAGLHRHHAVLVQAPDAAALDAWASDATLAQAAFEAAVLVLTPVVDEDLEQTLLQRGVQAILPADDPAALWRAVRHAVTRKKTERALHHAYATDLATGLPHQTQLLEHMTQLLALRERQPAPMVLIVLRVEGFAQAATQMGVEAANVLRRKVAVRLRGLLRASDVVAAIAPDTFGVLLGHLDAKADGQRVAGKLVRALQQPVLVAGQACRVAAVVGLALYPDHGKEAQLLLQHAIAQAGQIAVLGAEGLGAASQRGGAPAANDEG